MTRLIEAVEGLPVNEDLTTLQLIRERLDRLRHELRPRVPFTLGGASLVIQNLVGSVQLAPGSVLHVKPKTGGHDDWASALIDLLVDERAVLEAETDRAQLVARPFLPAALAARYADTLEHALRQEGPLTMLERRAVRRPTLAGRLDVTAWVGSRALDPARFPQFETSLTVDNPFTQAMAWVAERLAVGCGVPRTAARLTIAAAQLRPGLGAHTRVDPGIASRGLPAQWRSYQPAWGIARAVLRRIAPIHRSGTLEGVGLAIEPWPLLERLLVRSLNAAAGLARSHGADWDVRHQSSHRLLEPHAAASTETSLGRLLSPRNVMPDGTLWMGHHPLASFEAKYSLAGPASFRAHYFQAVTTAAAVGSPLAVLVYPEASGPVVWDVEGFDGRPAHLVAVGLDMYSYRRGAGDVDRGARLYGLVESVRGTSGQSA